MTNNIRAILSPLLIISYVFGTRIVEFPASVPRPWLSYLYIVLLWSAYHFLLVYTNIYYIHHNYIVYYFCFWLNIFTALLTITVGMYHDKKFRNCLRKLDIVDNTFEKLGIMTDYHKLYMRILLTAFGWFVVVLWLTSSHALWHGYYSDIGRSFCIAFVVKYAFYVNLIDDLLFTNTLEYIELKFDQLNEYLRMIENDKEHAVKRTREHSALRPRRAKFPKSMNSECNTWIVIHLHLELRKISRELNSIFGLQMTVKMGTYFAFTALGFSNIFDIIFGHNNLHKNKLSLTFIVTLFLIDIFRLFIINYTCEEVSIKANAAGDIISKISYSISDVVVRENISLFLLQMGLTPLRFYGLGLFRFGLKFLQGFCTSVTTVIVILIQSNIKK